MFIFSVKGFSLVVEFMQRPEWKQLVLVVATKNITKINSKVHNESLKIEYKLLELDEVQTT